MASLTRTANLLQEAIEGASGERPRVRHLLPTVAALGSVSLACRPDPDFVAELGRRLQAEAAELAEAAGTAARGQTDVRARVRPARDPGPVIILVGRGLPRLLAGVAASLMAIGGVVGVASRAALPGQALYPVKQVLDTAAVSMAGTDLDKGSRLLSQAQEHIVEASRLVEAPDSTAADVNLALQGAIDDVSRAQALLQRSFAETHDPQALRVSGSFSFRRSLAVGHPEFYREVFGGSLTTRAIPQGAVRVALPGHRTTRPARHGRLQRRPAAHELRDLRRSR